MTIFNNGEIDELYLERLLSNTESLASHVHWFQQELTFPPGKSHRGVSINHVDIQERRDDFISSLLKNTDFYSRAALAEAFHFPCFLKNQTPMPTFSPAVLF